jgi:hypothetical protein
MRIGVLSFQGNVEEHEISIAKAARALGENVEVVRVRKKESIDGLVIPGGGEHCDEKVSQRDKNGYRNDSPDGHLRWLYNYERPHAYRNGKKRLREAEREL